MGARTVRIWAGASLLVVSGILIALATLTPTSGTGGGGGDNPFCLLACGPRGLADVLANLLLFLPFGLSIGWLTGRRRFAFIAGLLASTAIELAQFWPVSGRDANLSDVISNAAGALLGAGLVLSWARVVHRSEAARKWRLLVCSALVLAVVAATGALLQPALPSGTYAVKWTEDSARYSAYLGAVIQAEIGTRPIPISGGVLRGEPEARLMAGEPLRIAVRAVEPQPGLAHLMSFERAAADVVFAGIYGTDVVLRYRTRGGDVRLDEPGVRLRDALTGVSPGQPVYIEIRRERTGFCLAAAGALECPEHSAGSGWRLFYNVDSVSDWLRVRINALWLFLLGVALGPWVRRDLYSIVVVTALVLGFGLLSQSAGLVPLSPGEAASGMAGLLIAALFVAMARRTSRYPLPLPASRSHARSLEGDPASSQGARTV